MTLLITAVAGSFGALARYALSGAVQQRSGSAMPLGTAAVDLTGALGAGLVLGIGDPSSALALAAVGFLGGFTTFSTWMIETVRLGITPVPTVRSTLNLLLIPAAGVMLAALGYWLTN